MSEFYERDSHSWWLRQLCLEQVFRCDADYSKDIIGSWYGTPFENEKSNFYRMSAMLYSKVCLFRWCLWIVLPLPTVCSADVYNSFHRCLWIVPPSSSTHRWRRNEGYRRLSYDPCALLQVPLKYEIGWGGEGGEGIFETFIKSIFSSRARTGIL